MTTTLFEPETHQVTAAEFRRMSPYEQDAILASAAERASHNYSNDLELTVFEAFARSCVNG
jgi:hypothetical protein